MRQKKLRKRLSCPNCRNELPLEEWKEKRNHDENWYPKIGLKMQKYLLN